MTRVAAVAVLTTLLLWASAAWSQGPGALVGSWEEYYAESGEYVRADFGADGLVTIEIFDYGEGFYLLDVKQHKIAVYETEEERENLSERDWVVYEVRGNKLTIIAGPEEAMAFLRIDRPEKTVSPVVGCWRFDPAGTDFDWEGDVPPEILLEFNNDGSASFRELERELTGDYTVDLQQGTIEMTLNGEVDTASYALEGDTLTIATDDETHVFTRVE